MRMTIESNGTSARVTVSVNAKLPNPMPSGEEEAIGVDFYRAPTQAESDYQLYASGDDTGWVAFLDTPKGFVQYPGTFQIGGSSVVFTVPWSSLGGSHSGYASVFMDWDRQVLALNPTAEDHLPDNHGKVAYR